MFSPTILLLCSKVTVRFVEVSLLFKLRVCVRHGAVFNAAVPVDPVVGILVNPLLSPPDPLDNLLLSSVSNEAEKQKNQEEEDED